MARQQGAHRARVVTQPATLCLDIELHARPHLRRRAKEDGLRKVLVRKALVRSPWKW